MGKGLQRRLKNLEKAQEGNLVKQLQGKAPRGGPKLPEVDPNRVADLRSVPRSLRAMMQKKKHLEFKSAGRGQPVNLSSKQAPAPKTKNKFKRPVFAKSDSEGEDEKEDEAEEKGEGHERAAVESGAAPAPSTSGRPAAKPHPRMNEQGTLVFSAFEKAKKVTTKRKEYLKKRDEKKRKGKGGKAAEEEDDINWQKREQIKFGETADNVPKFNLKRKHWAEQEELSKKKPRPVSGPAAAVGTNDAPPKFAGKHNPDKHANDRLKRLFMKQLSEAERKMQGVPVAERGRPRIDPGEHDQLRSQMISAYRANKPQLTEGIANPTSLKTLVTGTGKKAQAQ